jgi:hypothetical protein
VRVGKRDVTSRFSRRGSAPVAELTRHDGLQYGDNELSVLVQRRGRRPLAEARAFVLVRSQPGFVRARVNAGPVTSLTTFALGVHYIGRGVAYPPATLTNTMFTPLSQNGDGMQQADFMWQQYTGGFPPTDIYACF